MSCLLSSSQAPSRPTLHSNYGPTPPLSGVLRCRLGEGMGLCGCVLVTGFCWDFIYITICIHTLHWIRFMICLHWCESWKQTLQKSDSWGLRHCWCSWFHAQDAPKDHCVGLYVNGSLEAKYRQFVTVFKFAFLFVLIKQFCKMWNIWCETKKNANHNGYCKFRNPVCDILFGINYSWPRRETNIPRAAGKNRWERERERGMEDIIQPVWNYRFILHHAHSNMPHQNHFECNFHKSISTFGNGQSSWMITVDPKKKINK